MGLPIAKRLIEAGAEVVGYDVLPEAQEAAQGAGVYIAETVGQVAARTEATFVIVGFDEELRSVCFDPDGIIGGAEAGHVVFVCSTVQPDTVVEIAGALGERGVRLMDATLCRAEHAAHDGTLLVLCGGDQELFDEWESVIRCFASDIVLLGRPGAGQIGKMLNNFLLWINVAGDYEALLMGERLGLRQETLIPALQLGSGANWALGTWHKSRPMPWAEDDLDIFISLARKEGVGVPLATLVRERIEDLKRDKAEALPDGVGSSMQVFVDAVVARTSRASEMPDGEDESSREGSTQ
jgi:3-hydroxyisobutyrate dehydrogenase-like beta-hydroxyacid dehydrogenase